MKTDQPRFFSPDASCVAFQHDDGFHDLWMWNGIAFELPGAHGPLRLSCTNRNNTPGRANNAGRRKTAGHTTCKSPRATAL